MLCYNDLLLKSVQPSQFHVSEENDHLLVLR